MPPIEARKRNSSEQPRETSPSKKRSPSPEKEKEVTDVISINEFEQEMKTFTKLVSKSFDITIEESGKNAEFVTETLGDVLTKQAATQQEILDKVTSLEKDVKDILSLLKLTQRPLQRSDKLPIIPEIHSSTHGVRNESSETIQPFSQQKSFDKQSSLENYSQENREAAIGQWYEDLGWEDKDIDYNEFWEDWMYRYVSLNFFYQKQF